MFCREFRGHLRLFLLKTLPTNTIPHNFHLIYAEQIEGVSSPLNSPKDFFEYKFSCSRRWCKANLIDFWVIWGQHKGEKIYSVSKWSLNVIWNDSKFPLFSFPPFLPICMTLFALFFVSSSLHYSVCCGKYGFPEQKSYFNLLSIPKLFRV